MKTTRQAQINISISSLTTVIASLLLLLIAILAYLASNGTFTRAAGPTGLRQYYLTWNFYNGSQANDTVCGDGYHFAALWEIIDTSNLEYNKTLGYYLGDSGSGPPSVIEGWVRTGYNPDVSTNPGQANCNEWTSASLNDHGTVMWLDTSWSSSPVGWEAAAWTCNNALHVWCIED